MRLLFLGFSSPVAGLEATEGKVAQERLGLEVGICGEKFPADRMESCERKGAIVVYPPLPLPRSPTLTIDFSTAWLIKVFTRKDPELHSEHSMKFESLQSRIVGKKTRNSASTIRERGFIRVRIQCQTLTQTQSVRKGMLT